MSRIDQQACGVVAPLLDEFGRGTLRETTEHQVRAHLAACADCRALAAEGDPSVLFFQLRGTELPDSFWSGFNGRLRARLDQGAFRWADLFRYPKLAYLTAPVAMLLVLGVTLFVAWPGGSHLRRWTSQGRISNPYEAPESRSSRETAERMLRKRDAGGFLSDDIGAQSVPPALEEAGEPGARVYRFNVGEGQDVTEIFLVVDESIDI